MMMSPQVSCLFFEVRAKRPYLAGYGRSESGGETDGVRIKLLPLRFYRYGNENIADC
jgi:hypothetical protein